MNGPDTFLHSEERFGEPDSDQVLRPAANAIKIHDDGRVFLVSHDEGEIQNSGYAVNRDNLFLLELIKILDQEPLDVQNKVSSLQSPRLKSLIEEALASKSLFELVYSVIDGKPSKLTQEFMRFIESTNPYGTIHEINPHRTIHTISDNLVVPISEEFIPLIKVILEHVKELQKSIPHILSIAPYLLENSTQEEKEKLQYFSRVLLLLDVWGHFPEYIGGLIPADILIDSTQRAKASLSINIHKWHPLAMMRIWDGQVTQKVDKDELAAAKKVIGNLYVKYLPPAFPFVSEYANSKHHDIGIGLFERILLSPEWVARKLLLDPQGRIKQNLQRLCMEFFRKYKKVLIPCLEGETHALLAILLAIFGREMVKDYISRYCLEKTIETTPSRPKKKKQPQNKLGETDSHKKESLPSLSLKGENLVFSQPLGDDQILEYSLVAGAENWQKVEISKGGVGDMLSLVGQYYDGPVFFRVTSGEVGQSEKIQTLHFTSEPLQYIKKYAPKLKNEYLLNQAIFQNTQVVVEKIFDFPRHFEDLFLFVSQDDGNNWQAFFRSDIFQLRDFNGGKLKLAFSPQGIRPHISATFSETCVNKKTNDIQKKIPESVQKTLSDMSVHAEENPYDTIVLAWYQLFLSGKYSLELLNSGSFVFSLEGTDWDIYFSHNGNITPSMNKAEIILFLDLVQEEILQRIGELKKKHEGEVLKDFLGKTRSASLYVKNLCLFGRELFDTKKAGIHEILKELRHNGGFAGVMTLTNGFSDQSNTLKQKLSELGINMTFSRVNEGGKEEKFGKELKITITYQSFPELIGEITTSAGGQQSYILNLANSVPKHFEKYLKDILVEMAIFLGSLGKYHAMEDVQKTFSKEEVTQKILGKRNTLSGETKTLIQKKLKSFESGHGKICLEFGFDHELGCYMNEIHSQKNLKDLLSDMNGYVILNDERISSVSAGRQGQEEAYNLLRSNIRMQKYLILRLLATLGVEGITEKDSFTNAMKDEFLVYWNMIPESERENFVSIATVSRQQAIDIQRPNGIRIFEGLIEHWRLKKVPMIYSLPNMIPIDEFVMYGELCGYFKK